MSLLRIVGKQFFTAYREVLTKNIRLLYLSPFQLTAEENPEVSAEEKQSTVQENEGNRVDHKDRNRIIPVETSIRYLKSEAYQQTYQGEPVWKQYRRNHKGLYPPRKTRKTCIRQGRISTGNPCPICRDEYLVLDHRNVNLIKQFISPQSGKVLSFQITGLCQKKHLQLLVAVERAMNCGLITYDVPFRKYDYSEYYPAENQ
ncbi:small ribosomal subunit protein mS40 [Malaya genurostris]|uniref:small ribosomal subunit protein mS40 n=1 Tax=Malaya genurostris TaxID=325434 RepID=UPI0026F3A503|nr:small ribosomal subunit protein mS40 [Malaya genurostris]XP_058453760.1 small ribosomal subunit protein mS40 [Malaya genurostris]